MLPKNAPKTKIIATIGPSSWDDAVLKRMIDAGMTVVRINASFADHAEMRRVTEQVRRLSGRIGIMIDTQGHKLRISSLSSPFTLSQGQPFSLFTHPTADGVYIETDSSVDLAPQVPVNAVVLIDDGAVRLQVTEVRGSEIVTVVTQGGTVSSRKSVMIPGITINFNGMSKKDYEDILLARELGVDFVAASYVRSDADILSIRELLSDPRIAVISKIENEDAVTNFDRILEVSDAVMVARGDLGLEIQLERVPVLQKQLVSKCNTIGKPVIVATQMLQSMTKSISPTRAEVSDVATAIFDGADAVMLSAETGVGSYPAEAVETMARISREVEKTVLPVEASSTMIAKPTTNAIAQAVKDCCDVLPVDAVLVATATGTTARTISRFHLRQPIFAFTRDPSSARKLSISRGITADVFTDSSSTRDSGIQLLVRSAVEKGYVTRTDLVVVVAGSNILGQGETNMLEINRVETIISA
ncbi:MAG: pyruvate kinase [Candidatus Dojkabacteria bacterium]|nr:pyruvate kinase [Candidatus Dojkabacteria bacterium]